MQAVQERNGFWSPGDLELNTSRGFNDGLSAHSFPARLLPAELVLLKLQQVYEAPTSGPGIQHTIPEWRFSLDATLCHGYKSSAVTTGAGRAGVGCPAGLCPERSER